MPSALKVQLSEAVKADGYGGKGKSRWVREALKQLFEDDPELVTVGLGDALETNDAEDTFYLDEEGMGFIDHAVTMVRAQDPRFEGVQSALLRAAIRWRFRGRSVSVAAVTAATKKCEIRN